jgi:hypothetical protein
VARVTLLILACLVAGCRAAPTDVERAALALFPDAGADESVDARRLVWPEPEGQALAALRVALAAVETEGEPTVERSVPLPDGEIGIDLSVPLAGGGVGQYAVECAPVEGGWRVVSFRGPGLEWPPPRAVRGDGLTSSAVPRDQAPS